MAKRLGRLLAPLVLLVACTAPAALGAPPRACLGACRNEQRTCVSLARTRARTLRETCASSASAAACKRGARAVKRISLGSCRRLRKDCRACCRAGGQGPRCPVGHPVAFEPPPPVDVAAAGLPPLPNGNFLVLTVPGAQLEIDPSRRDPLTAGGACARWITGCVETGNTLDDCTRSAPPCATERPWEEAAACCPATCFERYESSRQAGAEPIAAFDAVYFGQDTCFPGVAALLTGAGR
jgi:hypothetical protein